MPQKMLPFQVRISPLWSTAALLREVWSWYPERWFLWNTTLRSTAYWAKLEIGHLHSLHPLAHQPFILAASGLLSTPWPRPAGKSELFGNGGTITSEVCRREKWMVIIQGNCSSLNDHESLGLLDGNKTEKNHQNWNLPTSNKPVQLRLLCTFIFAVKLSDLSTLQKTLALRDIVFLRCNSLLILMGLCFKDH